MSSLKLALRNIRGSSIRSLIILLCVLGLAAFFVTTTLIVRGAQNSLQRGLERLGADILVVPAGAEAKVETALLMGKPTEVWMSEDYLKKVAAVPGVASVSPQIYLQSLYGASCCSVSEMFLVVFDPPTDFSISPWLQMNLGRGLAKGEIIGGSYIFTPPGERFIRLYGYNLTLRGNLEATGTGIDQTIFMTRETAQDIALSSLAAAEKPLQIPAGQISSVMVKVQPGADVHRVNLQILQGVLGITPLESPSLFGSFRQQMLGLLDGFLVLLVLAWVLAVVLLALVFSLAVNERYREIAVLRAMGATRNYVYRSLLTEAAILAQAGGAAGIILSCFSIYLFKDYIAGYLHMPFLFPSLPSLGILVFSSLALSVITVIIASLVPTVRVNRQEPAIAMRE
jgi:putative ABC transport system permease protein